MKTSVDQPTTLVIKLPDDCEVEVVWKGVTGEAVNHPVLPDGSLYIVNTDLTDQGEYTVIVNGDDIVGFEKLQLTVVDPQPPAGWVSFWFIKCYVYYIATVMFCRKF